jgi:hypothetical protein
MNETIVKHIITDRKVVIVLSNGKTGVAFCSPNDFFNEFTGTELALKRAYGIEPRAKKHKEIKADEKPKFKVGDRVEVIAFEKMYPTYKDWFNENGENELYSKWECHNTQLENSTIATVKAIHPHHNSDRLLIFAIQPINSERIYLIEEKGIKKIEGNKTCVPTSAKNLIGKYATRVKPVNGDHSYMGEIVKILAADDYGVKISHTIFSDTEHERALSAEWVNDWIDRTDWEKEKVNE